ncbi:saga complex component [Grosmannia clavigera kw1407]|uniref:Saga complex component n=1 Tax=Grosmannia clavigera (strain kw1407 / UAMH 11150) TaxID=655863 RepID=F0XRM1_GROCL|nr:saga complex component [Grosmannia clavigera kw1407]EFW99665.1 saga complex component [Grosmannia clavigera kw1407]
MASQRNRNARGPNRNGGQGEEFQLWQSIKEELRTFVELQNADNDNVQKIITQDTFMAQNTKIINSEAEERKQEEFFRRGVRSSEAVSECIKTLIGNLELIRAIQKGKEEEAEQKPVLPTPSRSKRDPYDFDGLGDEPDQDQNSNHAQKFGSGGSGNGAIIGGGGSDRPGNRDSLPPRGGDRDTPVKADSVEPQGSGSSVASAVQRSKVMFVKGQDVVFKPSKAANPNETTEWFLGKVQQVLGEGKSRRYKVKDEDPDVAPELRQEYRTSASNMIPLPPPGQELLELERGKTVLALYPDSTTFYKAEVMNTDKETGKVNLRFEGEENSGTLQEVERRFVVEYRN